MIFVVMVMIMIVVVMAIMAMVTVSMIGGWSNLEAKVQVSTSGLQGEIWIGWSNIEQAFL